MSSIAQSPVPLASDEAYWNEVAARYPRDDGPINLDNGYFGRMSQDVVQAYESAIEQVNRSNAVQVRGQFDKHQALDIRRQLAELMGLPAEELAFARSATEALHSLIRNYNRLQPGDQVLISDLDYHSVQDAFHWLHKARGVEVIVISHQHPATWDALIQAYTDAFSAHPRLKLMALTHVTHRTGLVMPVKAIAHAAKARGIDVIFDGAHSLGQLEVDLADIGIDFAAFNLQKWIGAPLSLGVIHVRRERLQDFDPEMGNQSYASDDIRCLAPYGTPNVPALMSLPAVFAEHRAVGGWAAKGARLRYLRDLWVGEARKLSGIEVLTPDDPRLYCGLTAFRFTGTMDQQAGVERLLKDFNLFTVARQGSACGPCIRITPGLNTRVSDMQALVAALEVLGR
ncbi:aminotransferase class V-fold PLP-dependent enzyme [Pseudomonas sp. v388]|uniref:aminotransferase class V-fold PLP-dependent enzyme n=1 Tax=Pseudomonas sp. v388 TaxID=2479849 RepID=UPI000F7990FD|nr:aminotransferase class V-fold PLP-dependent enzyme [Pseudomonas sp. v388]RRV10155.1 aminotransferase class V-fold PLP-dependent enzyme [Pseudomonas sp. v388]